MAKSRKPRVIKGDEGTLNGRGHHTQLLDISLLGFVLSETTYLRIQLLQAYPGLVEDHLRERLSGLFKPEVVHASGRDHPVRGLSQRLKRCAPAANPLRLSPTVAVRALAAPVAPAMAPNSDASAAPARQAYNSGSGRGGDSAKPATYQTWIEPFAALLVNR